MFFCRVKLTYKRKERQEATEGEEDEYSPAPKVRKRLEFLSQSPRSSQALQPLIHPAEAEDTEMGGQWNTQWNTQDGPVPSDNVEEEQGTVTECALCKAAIPDNPVDIYNHTVDCLQEFVLQFEASEYESYEPQSNTA
jgi:hypothetical protein